MAFLTGILTTILEWFLQKLGALGIAWLKQKEDDANIQKQANADAGKVQDAKTDEDRKEAIDTIINDTFK